MRASKGFIHVCLEDWKTSNTYPERFLIYYLRFQAMQVVQGQWGHRGLLPEEGVEVGVPPLPTIAIQIQGRLRI